MCGFVMNDIIVIKSLKQGIVCPSISVKFFRGNIGLSVLITIEYTKWFGHRLCNPASYGLQENKHLNFSYGKVKTIKLE